MNNLQIFNYADKQVRTITKEGEPWFVAKDVADVLGYECPEKMYARIEPEDRQTLETSPVRQNGTGGYMPPVRMVFINEGGVYEAVFGSILPEAKQFKRWITHEVIPSIRKHGAYMTPDTLERMISSPEFGIRLLSEIKAEREKRQQAEALVEAQKPKVVFADAVEVSKSSILIGDLAKIIKQNGYDTGQKRLFESLRQNGYLMKGGSSKNMPTQRAMDAGLFEVKESTINNPDGSVRITKTTKVTGKGQVYFVNLFLAQKAV